MAIALTYGSWTALTFTVAGIGSSATVGYQSDEVDNTTNKFHNVFVRGVVTVGATVTANSFIQIWALGRMNNTPTRPDAFGATAAARTILSVGHARSYMNLGVSIECDTTTANRPYNYAFELAQLFGGVVPDFWTLWMANQSGGTLHATAGNHVCNYQGITWG